MKTYRHGEEVSRHRTGSIVSNSNNSETQTILARQSLYSSCGPSSPQMAYVTAWRNWQTSLMDLDPTGIWLHDPIPSRKRSRQCRCPITTCVHCFPAAYATTNFNRIVTEHLKPWWQTPTSYPILTGWDFTQGHTDGWENFVTRGPVFPQW